MSEVRRQELKAALLMAMGDVIGSRAIRLADDLERFIDLKITDAAPSAADSVETAEEARDGYIAELEEALRPFARYAEYMAPRWGALDDSAYYGTKRGPCVTYGDWRRAARTMKVKP